MEAIPIKTAYVTNEQYEYPMKAELFAYPKDKINLTTEQMEKHLRLVLIKGRDNRTKY